MRERIAHVVSQVFYPEVVLPAMVLILVLDKGPIDMVSGILMLVIGAVGPVIAWAWEYIISKDQEINPTRMDRIAIYMSAVFGFVLASFLFGSDLLNSPFWFRLSTILAILFASLYIINLVFDKASGHVAMFSFAVMLISHVIDLRLLVLLSLVPLVAWSRVEMKKHTWVQIFWGLVVGMSAGLLTWTL